MEEEVVTPVAASEVGHQTPPRKSSNNNSSSSAIGNKANTSTPGKLRRKVNVETELENVAPVQRLVEYFLIVSCHPRPENTSRNINSSTTANAPPPSPQPNRAEFRRAVSTPIAGERESFTAPFSASRKKLNKSMNNIFRKKEKSGTDNAIEATLSQDQETDKLQETLPPPKPRGTWKKNESELSGENIHIPETSNEHTFQPKVTARYPDTDYEDNPFNPMITQFCYPVGDLIVPTTDYEMPKVHHFVLTNDRGRKVYGTCLTIYEEYKPPADSPWRSKDLVLDKSGGTDIEVTINSCDASLYLPRCLCILSIWPYLSAFREYLTQLYRLATSTNCMSTPIERYIMNICMEIPAPPPGAFEVQVNILDSIIRFWSPPAKLPIAYVAMPYQILFECLDIENVLHLWYCLTMERKVLLVSSQHSTLTICAEILCSLLYPMKWSHLYVPLLPHFLCPMLDAPVPYLCGITRHNWFNVQHLVSEDTIVVDLDRNSLMFGENTTSLPPVPGKKWKKLQNNLEDIAGHLFWRIRGLEDEFEKFADNKLNPKDFRRTARQKGESRWKKKLDTYDQAFNLQFTPDSESLRTEASMDKDRNQWDRLQEAFLRFFVTLLKDYRRFLNIPDSDTPLSPNPDTTGWSPWSKKRFFNRDGFLSSQKPEHQPYLSELCATQQFDDFITKRLYSPEVPDIIFFDQSIDAKLNRSRLKLRKVDTPLVNSAKAHKVLKKFLAVEPSASDLKIEGPFVYQNWPETFDKKFFCNPRPIPSIITAEFDRQTALVARLRSSYSPGIDADADLIDFYGSDYDTSPEGMAFTVFYYLYCTIIGREWREYQIKRNEVIKAGINDDGEAINEDPIEAVESADIEGSSSQKCEDITLGVCDSCPAGKEAVNDAVTYVTTNSPCQEYINDFNTQAQGAYDSIAQVSPFADQQRSVSLVDNDEDFAEYEEAREVAVAQLDLAFDTLKMMEVRGLLTDPDVFKSLMEACGRCGDTKRALELIETMKRDGLVADNEVLSCFMAAFAHDGGEDPGSIEDDFNKGRRKSDAYSAFLRKKLEKVTGESISETLQTASDEEESSFSDILSESGSDASIGSATRRHAGSALLDWFTPNMKTQTRRRRRRRKRRSSGEPETDRLLKQIVLGESLLDFLYPRLSVDTRGNACPQCSTIMKEDDVISGWQPCQFQDFTTGCPQCGHRFVPHFTVSCASPTFQGSQGLGTPLYCEFLSPWVLRKELNHIIAGDGGIDQMLDPDWRSGTDVRATLWWNLIVLFRLHRLPFSFLLQGSFQNRLINPAPQD